VPTNRRKLDSRNGGHGEDAFAHPTNFLATNTPRLNVSTTHMLVERRGAKEDAKLELEFRRICDGSNQAGKMPNLDIRFMDKKHNSTGLQFADLVAQPIA
jgi:hypothetical protein